MLTNKLRPSGWPSFPISEFPASNICKGIDVTEAFRASSQSLQANAVTLPSIRWKLLQNVVQSSEMLRVPPDNSLIYRRCVIC